MQPDLLERVLRLLLAHGVFEVRDGGFAHTPASRLLRTDHPRSIRAVVRLFGLPPVGASQGTLMHSLRSGQVAAEEVQPGASGATSPNTPKARAIFNAAMSDKAQGAHGHIRGVLAAYDFSGFSSIADIGGGRGHLLMEVIHDWDDTQAVSILEAVRRAAPSEARVLVIEQMIPDDPGPHWAKTPDLHMLALLGGRQRSRQQYAALLERAGFAFQRQIDTRADVATLEASPA